MLSELIGALEAIEEIKNQCGGYITVYAERNEMSANISRELFDRLIDIYTISKRDEGLWEKSSTVNGIRLYALYCIDELNEYDLLEIRELENEKV